MILVDPVASKTADVSVSINTERQSIPTSPLEHAIYRHRERMHFSPIYCGEYINVGPMNKLIDYSELPISPQSLSPSSTANRTATICLKLSSITFQVAVFSQEKINVMDLEQ